LIERYPNRAVRRGTLYDSQMNDLDQGPHHPNLRYYVAAISECSAWLDDLMRS
jgi:hypothetical protein